MGVALVTKGITNICERRQSTTIIYSIATGGILAVVASYISNKACSYRAYVLYVDDGWDTALIE